MDQNVKPGSNWPNLSAHEKLAQMRRYREFCRKRDDTFLIADDFFVQQVLNEGLEQEYLNEIAFWNLL